MKIFILEIFADFLLFILFDIKFLIFLSFDCMLVGILNVKSHCVVGNGVVVHLRGLLNELKTLREADIDYKGNR